MRNIRWALPASVALLALVIWTTGILRSADAATGSIVNVADPTTAANVAKVDSTGALRTTVASGIVGTRQALPGIAFHTDTAVLNFYSGAPASTVLGPTTATLAVSNIVAALESTAGVAWDGGLFLTSATASTCSSPSSPGSTRKAVLAIPAGDTRQIAYGDAPLVLKPLPGNTYYCLVAQFGPLNGSSADTSTLFLQTTGYVASGSFTSPAAQAAPSSRSGPTAAGGHSPTGTAPASVTVTPSP